MRTIHLLIPVCSTLAAAIVACGGNSAPAPSNNQVGSGGPTIHPDAGSTAASDAGTGNQEDSGSLIGDDSSAPAPDSGSPSDAGDAATPFTCGGLMCAAGQYCNVTRTAGLGGGDAGGNTMSQCMPVPFSCTGTPSCACVESPAPPFTDAGLPADAGLPPFDAAIPEIDANLLPNGCSCAQDQQGHITVTCNY